MKFLYFTLILAALFMLMSQVEASCKATACKCYGVPNGLFCGDGNYNCIQGHVYQCGDNGQASCDYGIRNSCVQCNQLQC
ncbi:uncharacterized protein BX664DRAFT_334225 [Halteromyces radiatus]|uniref:uncharacterized protein n=1 Tax=Halteromyces radiatus TaxID=101107 RepID=UPI00221EA02F|nr:uncharacterized protein BX664DRAFT_334225 [Halteromyces radiatus]KAI8089921.1 hypothetical protein BX664DRAFT_334225 [Halteromyces radiatus]